MTDNEIIKSMECVIGNEMLCSECTYQKVLPFPSCRMMCAKNALDLINRQKDKIKEFDERNIIYRGTVEWQAKEINRQNAEIERLNIESETLATQLKGAYEQIHKLNMEKSEAIKEFAERLKEKLQWDVEFDNKLVFESDVDSLVKEMTEVQE